ncbi:TPA: restriction endonuclease subunit S [Clostridium perfringens]
MSFKNEAWKVLSFEESGLEIEDGDRGKNYPNKNQLLNKGYCPFLNNKNVIGDKLDLEQTDFITKERDELLRKGKAYPGDIILTTRGSIGNVALFNSEIGYDFVRINSGMVIIRNNHKFDLNFLYQQLKSPYMKSQYKYMATGSAQPQLPIRDIKKLKLLLPPIEEQKAIAKILSDLDEKIEINNKINKNLEEMAQAIFKQWFVDFEFPNEEGKPYKSSGGEMVESELGMIPKGWKISSLIDIADYLNGLAMQKFKPDESEKGLKVLKIKELRQGFTDEFSDLCSENIKQEYIVNNGDVIFSWSGTLLVDLWGADKCGLNQHLFKVTSNKYYKWYYYYWTKFYLNKFINIAKDKATTMGHIKRSNLSESMVFVPNDSTLKLMNKSMNPIITQVINNKVENRRLEKLRDTLLPKLMSGEIRVPLENSEN